MLLVGIDEVGRGCWAGPLVAGAVMLLEPIDGLADSKVLSKKRRNELTMEIKAKAIIGLGWVWPHELDTGGITWSVKTAMERALAGITEDYDELIIDGNINFLVENKKSHAIIKADGSIPAVSAASIVAKVARDTYMESTVHEKYPHYGFDKHVGYGTAAHIAALQKYGVCEIHRMSYKPIKKILTASI
jgi:ribonuclease HII